MFVLGNCSHQTQEMGFSAACAAGDKLDLAAPVFYILLEILFLPEVRKKINPAGELTGGIQCGSCLGVLALRKRYRIIFIAEIKVQALTSYSS